jgi:prepilin-type N-terminal cleavage/methylation domain-containing protein
MKKKLAKQKIAHRSFVKRVGYFFKGFTLIEVIIAVGLVGISQELL